MTPPEPRRPLRVLYVNHLSTRAGCVRSLRFLIRSFPPGRVEAHVLTPPGAAARDLRAAGARVRIVENVSLFQNMVGNTIRGLRWLTVLRAFWYLRHGGTLHRAMREIRPDLVHLNDHGMYQAAMLARRCGLPVVMHVRCVADRETWWQRAAVEHFLSRYVDRVVAIDESVRLSIRELPRTEVVYNPDIPEDDARGPVVPDPAGKVRVTFLTGLAGFKGLWDLLEAARLLRDRKDIVFQIYGGNRWPDAYYASALGRLGDALGITPHMTRRVAEWVRRHDLSETVRLMGYVEAQREIFARTDVLAFPSHQNGVGRSVFEAGVYGIPSVVTLKDRVEDIVQDGVNGLLAEERNPESLGSALRRLADDPALRARLGESARTRYLRQFDPARAAERILRIYESMLEPR